MRELFMVWSTKSKFLSVLTEDRAMKKIPVVLFTLCLVFFGHSGVVYSQVYDVFLYLEGIEGESIGLDHENEIDVLSWSWQMSSSSAMHVGGGGGVGEVIVRPMVIHKQIDKSSPLISLSLLKGSPIPEAVLTIRKAGENPINIARITMKNVWIIHHSVEGEGTMVSEKVALAFGSICYQYTPQNIDGSTGAVIEKCWNLETKVEF